MLIVMPNSTNIKLTGPEKVYIDMTWGSLTEVALPAYSIGYMRFLKELCWSKIRLILVNQL